MIPKAVFVEMVEPEEPSNLITSPYSEDCLLEKSDAEGIKAAKVKLKNYEYKNINQASIV